MYQLKSPFEDGTQYISMDPLDFIAKLVALIPPPRLNLIRFHGGFSPHYQHRKLVVPTPKQENENPPKNKYKPSWIYLLNRILKIDLENCKVCGKGKLKVLKAVKDPKVIRKILNHLKLPTDIPQPFAARGPPNNNDRDQSNSYDDFYQPSYDDF